jgi:hypothetical protein
MGTKLVKLQIPQLLHTRIKTVAASKNTQISVYILNVLEEHVPRKIDFTDPSDDPPKDVKQRKSPGRIRGT